MVCSSQASSGLILSSFLPHKCHPDLSLLLVSQPKFYCKHGHLHFTNILWLLDSKGEHGVNMKSFLIHILLLLLHLSISLTSRVYNKSGLLYEARVLFYIQYKNVTGRLLVGIRMMKKVTAIGCLNPDQWVSPPTTLQYCRTLKIFATMEVDHIIKIKFMIVTNNTEVMYNFKK